MNFHVVFCGVILRYVPQSMNKKLTTIGLIPIHLPSAKRL